MVRNWTYVTLPWVVVTIQQETGMIESVSKFLLNETISNGA